MKVDTGIGECSKQVCAGMEKAEREAEKLEKRVHTIQSLNDELTTMCEWVWRVRRRMTETQEIQDGLEKRMLRVMEVRVVREFHCRDWCSK